jgi:nucleoside-diphosphate kinase
MEIQKTLSIIKPDAVRDNNIGKILAKIEGKGLKIVAMKMIHLKKEQAEQFYIIHKERPFFNDLVQFMISGPVIVQVLEGEDAVMQNRDIMGATNPADALPGTIRKEFAKSIDENCVHGSDSLENAQTEIAFFFNSSEIFSR